MPAPAASTIPITDAVPPLAWFQVSPMRAFRPINTARNTESPRYPNVVETEHARYGDEADPAFPANPVDSRRLLPGDDLLDALLAAGYYPGRTLAALAVCRCCAGAGAGAGAGLGGVAG